MTARPILCSLSLIGSVLLLAGCGLVRPPYTPTPTATPTVMRSVSAAIVPTAGPTAVRASNADATSQPAGLLPTPTPEPAPLPLETVPPAAAIVAAVPTIVRQLPAVSAVPVTTDVPPVSETPPATDAPALLPPSPLEGDLAAAYPLVLETQRFRLHYMPGSVTATQPDAAVALVQMALDHLESSFGPSLAGGFDVYAAGSLFAPPDQALRGRSFSTLRRLFFLQDGSSVDWDRQYIVAHELTHLYLWNAIGAPSSVMLSEGAAVYAGAKLVNGKGPMPLQHVCLAYARAGALPDIADDLSYRGHIRDMENYYAAGCFVQYLIETYGVGAFVRIYPTSDYMGIYGKPLAALADEWQQQLAASTDPLPFEPSVFVETAAHVKNGYSDLFAAFGYTPAEHARYAQLDAARTALLEGRPGQP